MVKLSVNIFRNEDLSYPIYVGSNILDRLKDEIVKLNPSHVVIVTDTVVSRLHLDYIIKSVQGLNIPISTIVIPSGEKFKNRKVKEYIEDEMLKLKIDRKGLVIGFGGGVIGDISGFVSATYLRGINFILVPTTLLSMVDSSIGGKVGIDTPYGKNMIGAFHQPKAVIIDVSFLDTLPEVQFRNGLVEIIKHSIIKDKGLFEFLYQNRSSVVSKNYETLVKVIEWSCRIKKEVVEKDEKETGPRKILNFGHTVGHAIETMSNYKILHGFAVSVGMNVESLISRNIGVLSDRDYESVLKILKDYQLPTTLRDIKFKLNDKGIIKLIDLMKGDKKSIKSNINMSLPRTIGEMVETFTLTIEPKHIVEALKSVD